MTDATDGGRGDRSTSSAARTPAEADWLDETEAAAWLPLMRVLHLLPQQLDRQLRETAGVPYSYYTIMSVLSEQQDRELALGVLSQLVGSSPSRLTRAVDALCARGWLQRRRCEQDRRVHYARLTDEGLRVLRQAAPGHVNEVRRSVFANLSRQELSTLRDIASKIAAPLPRSENPATVSPP